MAHWAEIDENNVVLRVVVTSNDEIDEGYQWLLDNLGGRWIKTSYNCRGGVHYLNEIGEDGQRVPSGKPHLRYNFAEVGGSYDEEGDAFIPPKPPTIEFENGVKLGRVLDKTTYLWKITRV